MGTQKSKSFLAVPLEPIGAGEAEETLAAAKRIGARVRHLMEGA